MNNNSNELPRLARTFSGRRGGMIIEAILAVVGFFFLWGAMQLDIGRVALPGPGFFPSMLGASLMAFVVVIGLERWRSPEDETIELGHRDVLITLAALLAVPLLFEPLGAYITLGLFGTAMLMLLARVQFLLALLASSAGMALCWYFFQHLLGLQLPTGPW